jgi:hypothetical protein
MFNSLLNKSIANYIQEVYGDLYWQRIKSKIGIKNCDYIYSENETKLIDDLLEATSEITNKSKDYLIKEFAEYFIIKSAYTNYGALMASVGDSLTSCLANIIKIEEKLSNFHPTLHEHNIHSIFLIKPKYYKIKLIEMSQSKKQFIKGLLLGLSRLYKEEIKIKLLGKNEISLKIIA